MPITNERLILATTNEEKKPRFCINDHRDILIEILKRLDVRSLGVAACVCRQWCSITRNDAFWEHLCFHHVSPRPSSGVGSVVVALGGYKRLYMVCVQPALSRLGSRCGNESELTSQKVWTRVLAQLSLSLFCVDYYERLELDEGGRITGSSDASASSLMFLCKPVNV